MSQRQRAKEVFLIYMPHEKQLQQWTHSFGFAYTMWHMKPMDVHSMGTEIRRGQTLIKMIEGKGKTFLNTSPALSAKLVIT